MSYHVVEDSRFHGPNPTPRPPTRKHYIERPCLYCGLVKVLCTTLGHFHPIAIGAYFVRAPSVLLLLADDGCNNDHSPARCSGGGGLVWCWSWHAPCDPDGWRRSDHLLIGPLVTLCDVVWCCVMLCHKHTTFCHPMSRSTSSHLDTGTLEVWSSSQQLLSMDKYLILQI